jgi:hypothetical protein
VVMVGMVPLQLEGRPAGPVLRLGIRKNGRNGAAQRMDSVAKRCPPTTNLR